MSETRVRQEENKRETRKMLRQLDAKEKGFVLRIWMQ